MSTLGIAIDGYLSYPISIATQGYIDISVDVDIISGHRPRRELPLTNVEKRLLTQRVVLESINNISQISDIQISQEGISYNLINESIVEPVTVYAWSIPITSANAENMVGTKQVLIKHSNNLLVKPKRNLVKKTKVSLVKKRNSNE
jgi:hypothetical protein